MSVEEAKLVAHRSLLCYHSLCSILGIVEWDFFPTFGVHPQHRVTTDHEHQSELRCSSLGHHHLFPSLDSYCVVYALIRDRRETRVLFLSVYLAYKEDSSERKSKTKKKSKVKKISIKL